MLGAGRGRLICVKGGRGDREVCVWGGGGVIGGGGGCLRKGCTLCGNGIDMFS